jgi:hypothetical protein
MPGARNEGSGPSHTPLPWAISQGFSAPYYGTEPAHYVAGPNPNAIGIKLASPWIEGAWEDDAEAKANAEFIVRACNTHYGLVEALTDWRNTYLCPNSDIEESATRLLTATDAALAAATEGGDVKQAPGEASQSGGREPVTPHPKYQFDLDTMTARIEELEEALEAAVGRIDDMCPQDATECDDCHKIRTALARGETVK